MKLVYICSPYAGEIERNIQFVRDACYYAMKQNCAPVAVHLLYPQLLDDTIAAEREAGIRMGLRVLVSCDEVWVCGDRISSGMEREIAEAKHMGLPIRYVGESEIQMAVCLLQESKLFPATAIY